MLTNRFVRCLVACACAAIALVVPRSDVAARVDTAPVTVISDQTQLRQFSIAHNPDRNEYFALWREFDGFVETDVVGALLGADGKIITGPFVVAEQRESSSGTQLLSAGFWNTKVVYNSATKQYLALVARNAAPPSIPAADHRSSAYFGRLISPTGALVGTEVPLNPVIGVAGCEIRNPDLITDPATGGYTLVYSLWFTNCGGDLEGFQSVTAIQALSSSLGRGTLVRFPVINEEGPTSPRIGRNPVTGEFLVTQPYTGRFQIADNNNGRSFPAQRYSASLAPLGPVITIDTSPIVSGTGQVNEAIPVADPVTGNWFVTSTSRFLGYAWSNLLSPSGVSLRDGTAIIEGFPVAVETVGDGTFVYSTQSGTIVHVRADGTEIHSTTPFAPSIYENTSSVALAGTNGLAVGLAPGNAGIATAIVDVVAPGALPLSPARLLETRSGPDLTTIDGLFQGGGKKPAGQFVQLQVAGRGGVPANANAVMLNIAAAGAPTSGFITAYPCDAATRPTTSNLNYGAGAAASAAAIAKIAADGT